MNYDLVLDDFDEYRDFTDYSTGVFVDAVPISNSKRMELPSTEFDNDRNWEDRRSRGYRL